jgi:AhpD family alkylhydroperoxidase
MRSNSLRAAAALGIVVMAGLIGQTGARADDPGAAAAYKDMQATLGMVPSFFKAFPEAGIAGAWAEFKTIQLSNTTKLDGKTKQLIGLAVSAQIPCAYCIYFHTQAAKANGATDEEIREAVAMASITRHWSTELNGMQIDLAGFRAETDAVLKLPSPKTN